VHQAQSHISTGVDSFLCLPPQGGMNLLGGESIVEAEPGAFFTVEVWVL
jgi:hypothetical protein